MSNHLPPAGNNRSSEPSARDATRGEFIDELLLQKSNIDTALNNLSQGVLMFDQDARLILCNRRYLEMYDLSAEMVKPGCSLRDLVVHRAAVGVFSGDVDQYCRDVMATMAKGTATNRVVALPDGRSIYAVNHPIAGGGWIATHEDITERKQAQERLARETNENRRLFETSLDLILVTDSYGNFERVSPISYAILGYAPEEMIGRSAVDFIFPGDLEATRNEMRLARCGHTTRNFETRYMHKSGSIVTLAWSGVWSEPEHKHFFTGRDVTERKLVEETLNRLAHYDQLTGLPNRVSLHTDLDEILQTSDGFTPSAIAIFDLDGFKDINDTLGHSVGDQLLQEVGRRMTGLTCDGGRFYRLGGDEFVLLQPHCGDPLQMARSVEAVVKCIAEKFVVNDHHLFIGTSAGIAIATAGINVEELISNADLALYDAKDAGGNAYRVFMPVLRAQAHARRELDMELRRACANNEFELYFQPQVRADSGKVVGAEALLRWRHPHRGILTPGTFIQALAANPVAFEVGQWILQSACAHAAAWSAEGLPPLRIGVNLFPVQFERETLVSGIETAIQRSGLAAEALEIEITENIALSQDEGMLEALRGLRAKGVKLAFDDFGTGYASLSCLTRYPLTRIKIDQSFVRKIAGQSTAEDTAIVRSLIMMAHNLGLEVIAEGVETAEQAAFLRAEKCEELQGYLFAKPMAADEFEAYLRASSGRSQTPHAAALAG